MLVPGRKSDRPKERAEALSHDIRLEHVATRSYPSGMVQSEYVIAA